MQFSDSQQPLMLVGKNAAVAQLREPGTSARPGGGQSLRRDPERPSQDIKKLERWKIIWGFSIFPGAKLNTHAANPRKKTEAGALPRFSGL